jgi:sister chromatid cohesion protein DCC1
VKLSLLLGDYLRNLSSTGGEATLTYFPSSALPVDPAARFVELFLTRQRWKHEDIEHFLLDIAVNSKERDKLLLKHARALTDAEGVWYTARVSYNN